MASFLNRLTRAGAVLSLSPFWPGLATAQEPSDAKRDCLAASERGQNERDEGKFRAARQSFALCTHDICPHLVTDLCTKWLHELDQAAPTIVLSAKDEQGNDLSAVRVMFDGAPFATVLDGKPLEADSGAHVLRFEREGSAAVDRAVTLRAGERARLINVVLGATTAMAVESASSGTTNGLPTDVSGTSPRASGPSSTGKYVASGAMGVAALGAVGIGIYFMSQSNNNADEAATLRTRLMAMNSCSHPPLPAACQTLADKVQAQHDDMAVAMTLFAGGGLLAAGALATFFLWPRAGARSAQTSAWIAPTPAGLTIQVSRRFP